MNEFKKQEAQLAERHAREREALATRRTRAVSARRAATRRAFTKKLHKAAPFALVGLGILIGRVLK